MIVRTLESVIGNESHLVGDGFESRRLLLSPDKLGYSFHDTLLNEGCELTLEFKNHIETNYCIEGEGEVVDSPSGETHLIRPGTIYVLDKHDVHILRATKGTLRLVCVFTPALTGRERHDADGGYQDDKRSDLLKRLICVSQVALCRIADEGFKFCRKTRVSDTHALGQYRA
jgi:L-ectoine synthase